jgi:DNA-binding transcriptional LysR family regulator
MNISLKQIAAFRAVAQSLSFTAAARSLNVAQPVLSAQVRDLEETLGARLFDRSTRSVVITAAGAEFLEATADLEPMLSRATERVRDLVERRAGRLSIAAPPLLAASFLPGVITEFEKAYPAIPVRISDVPTELILGKLLNNEVELGIATLASDDERFVSSVVIKDRLLLFSLHQPTRDAPAASSWDEISRLPLIMLSKGSGIRALVDRAIGAAGITPRIKYEVMQVATAIALVREGLGAAILPSYAAFSLGSGPMSGLSAAAIEGTDTEREICAVSLRDRSLSPAAQEFARMLRQRAARLREKVTQGV